MSRIVVVTDSTASLTQDLLERSGIKVVPIHVIIDGRTYLDRVELDPYEVASALTAGKHMTTSRPTPADFLAVYEAAADAGAEQILSLHLSAAMSGTLDAAALAARDAPVPVTVVDSRTIGMGLGFAALNAARAAADGADIDEVQRVALATASASTVMFYVATLDFLRKGGRIGKASAWLGSALRVKPILHVIDGEVAPLEKARTSARALARLTDLAFEAAGDSTVQVAVQHLDNQVRADEVAAALSERLGIPILVCDISAVMGVHTGPGAVAVAVAPA